LTVSTPRSQGTLNQFFEKSLLLRALHLVLRSLGEKQCYLGAKNHFLIHFSADNALFARFEGQANARGWI
jgi:hypothetical protein